MRDALLTTLATVCSILAFRATPILVWGVVSRRADRATRVFSALAVPSLLYWVGGEQAVSMIAVYGYFLGVSCLAPSLSRIVRRRRVTLPATFALSALVYVAIPGLFAPPLAQTLAVALGFEIMLSAYSYVAEMARQERATSLADCLFFLLVNPALVYPDRGRRRVAASFDSRTLRRTLVAVGVLFVAMGLVSQAKDGAALALSRSGLHTFVVAGLVTPVSLFIEYLEHSAAASVQIGLMGQFGFDAPERYRAPLLASSPIDFWRRWNTYVGGWMQRYVFWPASLHLARRRSASLSFMPQAAGVLATFCFVGALHDLSGYFVTTGFFGRSLVVFGVSGALVLVWEGASRFHRAVFPRAGESPLGRVAFGVASRVAFWATMIGLFHWWTT